MNDDRRIIRNGRRHEISFFETRKRSWRAGLTVIKPSYSILDRLTKYLFRWRMNTDHVLFEEQFKKLRKQVKLFRATFKNTKFSREDQIFLFDFLTTFVQ